MPLQRLHLFGRYLTMTFLVGALELAWLVATTGAASPPLMVSLDRDGRFARSYDLGPLPASAEFGFRLRVLSVTQLLRIPPAEWDKLTDAQRKLAGLPAVESRPTASRTPPVTLEKWRSGWAIPQLQSVAYPLDRDKVVWQMPDGNGMVFKREDIVAKRFSPEGWLCEDLGESGYVMRDREGWVWRYGKEGRPETLTAPSGRLLAFAHDDKQRLVGIRQLPSASADQATAQLVLTVSYDDTGRPAKLVSGSTEHQFIYDAETGDLVAWRSTAMRATGVGKNPLLGSITVGGLNNTGEFLEGTDASQPRMPQDVVPLPADQRAVATDGSGMGELRFTYLNGLLASIRPPSGPPEILQWDEAKGRLKADGEITYAITGEPGDAQTFTATDRRKRVLSVKIDPKKGETVRTAPDGMTETTRAGARGSDEGLVVEKRAPDGKLLLQVVSNPRRLPVAERKRGEPELRRDYDALDRVTDLWRGPVPDLDAPASAGKPPPATPQDKFRRVQHITYDGDSRRPATITDANGVVTRLTYDARGQLVLSANPLTGEQRFAYDEWGRPVRRTLPAENLDETVTYDALGRKTSVKTADGRGTALTYDAKGRVETRTEDGVTFAYRYDDQGRQLAVLRNGQSWLKWAYGEETIKLLQPAKSAPNWPAGPALLRVATVAFTDPLGHTTKRFYDADGLLVEVLDPVGDRTGYRYDNDGQVIGWVDARGNALVLTRDKLGRITRQENALGQALTWAFFPDGRLAERSNGVQVARYSYDRYGRLEMIDYGKGQAIKYQRDAFGRIEVASTAEITTRYRYDDADRETRIEQHPKQGAPSGVAYTYTPAGQKETITLLKPGPGGGLVNGGVTAMTYDRLGRILTIALDGTVTTRNDYDPRTLKLARRHLGNGVTYDYDYDRAGRMSLLKVTSAAGAVIQQLQYLWDDYGQLAKRVLTLTPAGAPAPTVVELRYGYDNLGRLVAVDSPQDPRQNRKYTYDSAGNLVENRAPDRWIKMEYDAANQLLAKTEVGADGSPTEVRSFSYDAAGRMLAESVGGQVDRRFTYSYLDKVMQVDRPAEGRRAQYAYDANGMLVLKGTQAPAQGDATNWENWVWDGIALVQRGNEVFVNEPHPAGGAALMSRKLDDPGAAPAAPPPPAPAPSQK
jgi:YD repeat-containing protein